MKEPVLCYVDDNFAYFTTQKLEHQCGDDWDDVPYEHNAEPPYEDWENAIDGKEPRWTITKVAFESDLSEAKGYMINSKWSVESINRKNTPWLKDDYKNSGVVIWAGTTLSEFDRLISESGGAVYYRKEKVVS